MTFTFSSGGCVLLDVAGGVVALVGAAGDEDGSFRGRCIRRRADLDQAPTNLPSPPRSILRSPDMASTEMRSIPPALLVGPSLERAACSGSSVRARGSVCRRWYRVRGDHRPDFNWAARALVDQVLIEAPVRVVHRDNNQDTLNPATTRASRKVHIFRGEPATHGS
jgi:hypothetical protein